MTDARPASRKPGVHLSGAPVQNPPVPFGVPGVLAAASAALGLSRLSNWLALRGHRVLSPKRVKIATGLVVWVFVLAFYGVSF